MGKHSEWRKVAKKTRRKRIRQKSALYRDGIIVEEEKRREKSPTYQLWLLEKEKESILQAEQEEKLSLERELRWQKVEQIAQEQFKLLQKKLEIAKEERAKQNVQIKLEWERDQLQKNELEKQHKKQLEENLKKQESLNEKVTDFLLNGGDTPEHLKEVFETNPNKELCVFFKKTSTCRFFDICSRNHIRPGISRIILIPNFFTHYSLEKTENEQITDANLEFESSETYNHYREFFYDVIHEFEIHGNIKIFKTCCNHEAHLRGNVFVEYASTRSALKSYQSLNGRWYAGKQLSMEFCNIPSWKRAICGLYFKNRCPRGNACNFLHVFRNPGNVYNNYEGSQPQTDQHRNGFLNLRSWRWSESPERLPTIERVTLDKAKDGYQRDKYRPRHRYKSSRKHRKGHRSIARKKRRISTNR